MNSRSLNKLYKFAGIPAIFATACLFATEANALIVPLAGASHTAKYGSIADSHGIASGDWSQDIDIGINTSEVALSNSDSTYEQNISVGLELVGSYTQSYVQGHFAFNVSEAVNYTATGLASGSVSGPSTLRFYSYLYRTIGPFEYLFKEDETTSFSGAGTVEYGLNGIQDNANSSSFEQAGSLTGTLSPGQYLFFSLVELSGNYGSAADLTGSFTLDLSPVADDSRGVPDASSTATLAVIGLLGLLGLRRFRR